MAIKFKSSGLPYTSAIWRKLLSSSSSSKHEASNAGTAIPEVYFQDSTGVIAGVRLGTEHNVFIPAQYFSTPISRGDLLNIGNKVYEVDDIIENFYRAADGTILKSNSAFEANYQLNLVLPND